MAHVCKKCGHIELGPRENDVYKMVKASKHGLTYREAADTLSISISNASNMMDKLVRYGLIEGEVFCQESGGIYRLYRAN